VTFLGWKVGGKRGTEIEADASARLSCGILGRGGGGGGGLGGGGREKNNGKVLSLMIGKANF